MTYSKRQHKLESQPRGSIKLLSEIVAKHVRRAYAQGFADRERLQRLMDFQKTRGEILDPDTRALIYTKEQGWMK